MAVASIVLTDSYKIQVFFAYFIQLSETKSPIFRMASLGNLPFLSFAASGGAFDAEENPRLRLMERGIDRRTLLDIAPDRGELIMSNKSIEEYRETLKLRGTPSQL